MDELDKCRREIAILATQLRESENSLKSTRDTLLKERREMEETRWERDLALWRLNEIKKLFELNS